MRPRDLLLAGLLLVAREATATAHPVVLELFTSQGCSSCPPADALLAELARTRGDVLALDFHVTYWNRLGWVDPFSFAAATARQDWYAARFGDADVYTPELVVDGRTGVVGSDRAAVLAAIAAAGRDDGEAGRTALRVTRSAGDLLIEADRGADPDLHVLVVGFDPAHDTEVGGGENGGRHLHEVDVVRSLVEASGWRDHALAARVSVPDGQHVAVLLQATDGRILDAVAVS